MVQWVNHFRNNIFVNPPSLSLLCEISGALHLAQPGLTAGRLVDEIQVNFEIFKLAVGRNIRLVALFNQGTASLQPYQCIPASFLGKAYWKVNFYSAKFSGSYMISHQSLLLSTTVLNDIHKTMYIYITLLTVIRSPV